MPLTQDEYWCPEREKLEMDKVLEIGHFSAGFCGRLFAQNGAEVVRVKQEDPPAWASAQAMDVFLHSDKKVVDCQDKEEIKRLASKADYLILESTSADSALEWGIDDWDVSIKSIITPFGMTGPKRNWRASANVLLAMGGYTNCSGDPERAPLSLPGHYVEFQAGQFAYIAMNAAMHGKQRAAIDISMLECVMALSQFTTVQWSCADHIRSRHGNDFWWVVPTNMFRCADGWVFINITPNFWDACVAFLQRPELIIDARFETNALRMINRNALHEIIEEAVRFFSKSELRSRATECRIPLGVVMTFDEVLQDPHLLERDFWQTPSGDDDLLIADLPFRFDGEKRNAPRVCAMVDIDEVWCG